MAVAKKQFGQKGEQLALDHLKQQGYTVVETNWRCPFGEIDIVAREQDAWVFVEVRSRHTHNTESAFASITKRKQKRLQASAQAYLASHHLEDVLWRIDVIAIAVPRYGSPVVNHKKNALDW